METKYKKIILTGAASGIGKALFSKLTEIPIQIVAADINRAGIDGVIETAIGKPAECYMFCGDLSNPETVDRLFDFALEKMGGIDIFIANAGYPYYEKLVKPDWNHISAIFNLNTVSPIYALEKMIELNGENDFRMVMLSSAMAYMSIPGYALYSATKASLDRFAEGIRFELRDPRQLLVVYPIATRTAFFTKASSLASVPVPFPSQKAETVASAILKGLKYDLQTVSPSVTFTIFFFFARFLPFLRRLYQYFEFQRFSKWLQSTKMDTSDKD